jgi:uncharacterized phage protein (TIGR01671 family)
MREIKFRGKRIDNGEWVYGYVYRHSYDENDNQVWYILSKEVKDSVVVAPKTVEQYTGLKDKNGVEIYEGDICTLYGGLYKATVVYAADNARYGFALVGRDFDGADYDYGFNEETLRNCEVIGNIHDNPESLGGGK